MKIKRLKKKKSLKKNILMACLIMQKMLKKKQNLKLRILILKK